MLEKHFQKKLIDEIESLFPGCIILKNDANYIQGFPDLLILYKKKWAALEVKVSKNVQPNQKYYIERLSNLSYAAFIFPSNKEEVLNDLQQTFRTRKTSRVSKPK